MELSKSPLSRALARAVFAGLLAGLAVLGALIVDGLTGAEIIQVVISFLTPIGVWLGVGAATPLEPFLGSKGKVDVPAEHVNPV